MADIKQLRVWKAEAELALQKLALGEKTVSISNPEGNVVYNQSSMANLRAHIQYLDSLITAAGGTDAGGARKPIQLSGVRD